MIWLATAALPTALSMFLAPDDGTNPIDGTVGIDVVVSAPAGDASFDAERLRELLRVRLTSIVLALEPAQQVPAQQAPAQQPSATSNPVIASDCTVTVTVVPEGAQAPRRDAALVIRAARRSAPENAAEETIAAAEPGVMELELLRQAPRLVRAACIIVQPPAPIDEPARAVSHAARSTADEATEQRLVLVDVGGAAAQPPPRPASDASRFSHVTLELGALLRSADSEPDVKALAPALLHQPNKTWALDGAASLVGGVGLLHDGEHGLGAMGALELVAGGGEDVVGTEVVLAIGPGVELALLGGTARLALLVGPRVHAWWGTSSARAISTAGRTDVAVRVPITWTTRLGPVDLGATASLWASQVDRELRFDDTELWRRANLGVAVSLALQLWRGGT